MKRFLSGDGEDQKIGKLDQNVFYMNSSTCRRNFVAGKESHPSWPSTPNDLFRLLLHRFQRSAFPDPKMAFLLNFSNGIYSTQF